MNNSVRKYVYTFISFNSQLKNGKFLAINISQNTIKKIF